MLFFWTLYSSKSFHKNVLTLIIITIRNVTRADFWFLKDHVTLKHLHSIVKHFIVLNETFFSEEGLEEIKKLLLLLLGCAVQVICNCVQLIDYIKPSTWLFSYPFIAQTGYQICQTNHFNQNEVLVKHYGDC